MMKYKLKENNFAWGIGAYLKEESRKNYFHKIGLKQHKAS